MWRVSTFRDLGVGINSNAQLASDNDRVFEDLWRKDNMPTVLNNPYSESDKVQQNQSLPHTHPSPDVFDFFFFNMVYSKSVLKEVYFQ